jgi:AraC family transcriptional regulator of arabinose operon
MTDRSMAVYRTATSGPTRAMQVSAFGLHTIRSQIVDRILQCYAVVLVESGHGTLVTAVSGRHEVVGPALFFLVPGVLHSYGPAPGTAWGERWALFDGTLAQEFEAAELIKRGAPLMQVDDVTEMGRLFSTLHSEMLEHGHLSRFASAATLHRLIVRAAIQQRAGAADRAGPSLGAAKAIRALKERALEDLDLTALAAEFDVSAATLRRHCSETYGVPPKVLQTRLRLDRARELLAVTEETVEAIALAIGFEDSFYFSRVFLKHEGCSPSAFRKLNRRS